MRKQCENLPLENSLIHTRRHDYAGAAVRCDGLLVGRWRCGAVFFGRPPAGSMALGLSVCSIWRKRVLALTMGVHVVIEGRREVMRVTLERGELDAAGVRRVVEAHYDDVFAYCRRRVRTADEAQDATQETFLRFVKTADRYRDVGKPLAYLLAIARNVCIDACRAQARSFFELPDDEVLEDTAAWNPDARENGATGPLGNALASLPPDVREVVELRFDQRLKLAEIARVMGISRFAAKRRLDAALAAVREKMRSEGEGLT